MKNILIIGKILNINLKKYEIVSCENPVNDKMIFGIKRKAKSCICPQCGIRTYKKQAHGFRFKTTYFKKILAKSMINKTKINLLSN